MGTVLRRHTQALPEYHSTTLGANGRSMIDVATEVEIESYWIKIGANWFNQAGLAAPAFFSPQSSGGIWSVYIGHSRPFDYVKLLVTTPATLPNPVTWSYINGYGVETAFTPLAYTGADNSNGFFEAAGPTNEIFHVTEAKGVQRPSSIWEPYNLTVDGNALGKKYWLRAQTTAAPAVGGTGSASIKCRLFSDHASFVERISVWDDAGDGSYVQIRMETQFGTSGGTRAFMLRTKNLGAAAVKQLDVAFPGGLVMPRNMQAYFRLDTDSTNGVGTRHGHLTYQNGKAVS